MSAQQPGTDKDALGVSLKALGPTDKSGSSASFNNVNALDGSTVKMADGGSSYDAHATDNLSIVCKVTGTGAIATVGYTKVDTTATNLRAPHRVGSHDTTIGMSLSREKHHRWRLDRGQIVAYGLEEVMSPTIAWWEDIDLLSRRVDLAVVRAGITAGE